MKVGDLVITNQSQFFGTRYAGKIGFVADLGRRAGAYVLFTDGREVWFEDDELTAVATARTGEEDENV